MKWINTIKILIVVSLAGSCDNQLNFSDAPMNNVAQYDSIFFTSYEELPANSFPVINKYFTPKNPAKNYLATWLNSNYYSMDVGSTANVIYDFMNFDRPDSLNDLSQTIRFIGPMEYRSVWGTPFVESFTPSKSPDAAIPAILAVDNVNSTNPFRIVTYNYSTQEPVIEYNKEFYYLNQNFNSLTGATWDNFELSGYFIKDLSEKGRTWMTYVINAGAGNKGIMAYSNGKTGSDTWFITTSIDLSAAINPKFTFDLGTGYYKGLDCLKVLVSEDFNGEKPHESKWQDITNKLGVKNNPWVTGYPALNPMAVVELTEFVGKRINIAFQYSLPIISTNYDNATLYVVDNIKLFETRDVATISDVKTKYDIYKKIDGVWVKQHNIYILQEDDYSSLGRQFISVNDAEPLISEILKNKVSTAVDNIVVAYKNSATTTFAENYQYIGGQWEKEKLMPVTPRLDRYKYMGNEDKWIYQETSELLDK